MDIRSTISWKSILKGLFFAVLAAYLVFPVFLYGFTPMGPAVVRLVNRTIPGDELSKLPLPVVGIVSPDDRATPVPTPEKDLPITFLLLGYGGVGHDGGYLTDSIVLAMADPKAKSLTFLSIPRDTLVNLSLGQQGDSWNKINTAFAYGTDESIYSQRPALYKGPHGGGNLAKDAVSAVVGIPVRYYVALDFSAFRKFIDEVGGIEVTVPSAFSADYPREGADITEESEWMVVRFEAGKQRLSGERALQYARARLALDNAAEGSDFARSRRQRQIMQAFKDKVMSPAGLIRIPGLLNIATQRVRTDLEIPGLGELEQMLTDWRGAKIAEASLTSDNYLTSDASTENGYYLSPVAGKNDWSQIHTFVRILMADPPLAEELARTKVLIRDGSGQLEKAKELRARLQSKGFVVAPVEIVSPQPQTRIEDMTRGEAPRLIEALKETLSIAGVPVESTGYPSARVAIVLGQDQAIVR